MAIITILMGVILTLVGVIFFAMSESGSPTALIPAFFGLPLAILGIVLQLMSSPARRHVAHAAAALAALGTLAGLGMGGKALFSLLGGNEVLINAMILQLILGVCCAIIMVTAICSFRAARKAREAAANTAPAT